jgi:ribosomal protein S18 acetylase RimI-like enzyme
MVSDAAVTVRLAVPADAQAIGESHAEAWRVGYDGLFDADVLAAQVALRRDGWSDRIGAAGMEKSKLFVGECAGVVRGFAHVGPASDGTHRGEVYGFYAHPLAWGSGIAQAMMDHGLTALREMRFEAAIVWTMRDARRARRFYEKAGFQVTSVTKSQEFGQVVTVVEYARSII